MFTRTVMFVNQASDPVVERLLIPDLALAVAENIAVDERKRVLVLLSDMTAFADALKEVSIAMDQVPANRGYPGDLYSQLASRYEPGLRLCTRWISHNSDGNDHARRSRPSPLA